MISSCKNYKIIRTDTDNDTERVLRFTDRCVRYCEELGLTFHAVDPINLNCYCDLNR